MMKSIIKKSLWLLVLPLCIPFSMRAQSKDFDLGKNVQMFYSVLRELDSRYVDSLDVQSLVDKSLQYMLYSLDPYSEYIPADKTSDMELIRTGAYGGIGSIIKKIDSLGVMITFPYANSPAVKAGLEPGDIIIEIDGVDTKPIPADKVTDRMKGIPGTSVHFKILKAGRDTMDLDIVRERVNIPDMTYSGIYRNAGYIDLNSFVEGSGSRVREAVESMKGKVEMYILDLRGNGGGLMNEAVNVVSAFMPMGTEVLTVKGRDSSDIRKYYTTIEPVDSVTPLLVLVDPNSASSSEIVAGALQDYDRALVGGEKSYGKGLIQTISTLDFDSEIKYTIAKYYIPSGRCIQKVNYKHDAVQGSSAEEIPDSLRTAFQTRNGRTVYDGGGIEPDIEYESPYFSRVAVSMFYKDIFGEYAVEYYKKHDSIAVPSEFALTDEEYEDFVEFASGKDFDSRTLVAVKFDELAEAVEKEGLQSEYQAMIDGIREQVKTDRKKTLMLKKEEIKEILESEIIGKYYYVAGQTELSLKGDRQLNYILDHLDFDKLK